MTYKEVDSYAVHTTSNLGNHRYLDADFLRRVGMRGSDVVWTIAGVLICIALVVWLADNVSF
ncbi:membrane protein [Streptomyces phage Emma1919]|uniref:Uncharacterized protein n=2 Tax=Gilsonvirus gilson TaxID=2846398 RepID=A0A3T0ICL2_9CAUD|nr:hypothetical protein HWB98_gp145 [Streptomyces phage Gilson]QQV92475.1 membrane protein [Streptomyces phage MeganTheeKilla]QZE11248.1 hypothetical protein SEA_FORREST_120 [Streptomyces phage Forrest]QZE11473.1 hypothetical protein SEA_JADA_116 [Streptomyces phage Jada]URQ04720.1 membrane protein [Streptomyces phage Emma1919]AZU97184.1 hypothetical protein SEA_GILSON_115 [Streptomyces phage Gilson]